MNKINKYKLRIQTLVVDRLFFLHPFFTLTSCDTDETQTVASRLHTVSDV